MHQRELKIELGDVELAGTLQEVPDAKGLIIFAHGAGSSRLSPRNKFVADYLNSEGFSTLLFDLLTEREDENYENRFDINLITERLINVTQWLREEQLITTDFGYFGASTGAAAALKASIHFDNVKAIVSRGGRPDLVMNDLPNVLAPTLLIVGGLDEDVLGLNQDAYDQLNTIKDIKIVEGATHLFEEPGKLEEVARLAAEWFSRYLVLVDEKIRELQPEAEVESLEQFEEERKDKAHFEDDEFNYGERGEGNVGTQIDQLDVADRGDHGLGGGDTPQEEVDNQNIPPGKSSK